MTFKLPFLRPHPPNLEYLRNLSLFADLTPPELAIVGHLLHERDYLAGGVIFDEGEVGQAIYFLLEGEVTICRQGRPDDGQLARLDPGEFFGELGLLEDSIRTAQARANTDCRLLVLFSDDFNGLMDSHRCVAHKIGRQLLHHLGQRLREFGFGNSSGEHMAQLKTSVLLTTHAMECPFCGSTNPELIEVGATFWVNCTACCANGPSGDSVDQALERWNWNGHAEE